MSFYMGTSAVLVDMELKKVDELVYMMNTPFDTFRSGKHYSWYISNQQLIAIFDVEMSLGDEEKMDVQEGPEKMPWGS